MKHAVVFSKEMGIGNRIFRLFSFLRIFKPKEFDIIWDDKGWVTDNFFNLFEFNWDYEIREFSQLDKSNSYFENNSEKWNSIEGWRLFVDKNDGLPKFFQKSYFNSETGYSIDLEYNRTPNHILDIYLPYFNMLKPSLKVCERIKGVEIANNVIGLQVRNNADWQKRNVSLSSFYKIMDKYPIDTKFYLSTINKEVQDIFINKYGERIIVLPNKNHNSMIDAVSDLFLMAKCKELIVSYKSTFPAISWWLNGGKSKIVVVGENKFKNFFERIYKNFLILLRTGLK